MKILALETSGHGGEVALLDDDQLVANVLLAASQRTAQALAPAMASALASAGWQAREIALVAVTIGPGSFTGLRVGVTTAKTFAYAVGCDVLGIDTLEVIASQASPQSSKSLWAVLDAQRSQLFAAKFEVVNDRQWMVLPARIIDAEEFARQLKPGDGVTGSGLQKLHSPLGEIQVAPEATWQPRAVSVGQLAWRDYQQGRRDDLWALAPRYLRASAAEEKAAQS